MALACLLAGCPYNPHAHTYTTLQPSVEEVAGEYSLGQIYMETHAPGIRKKIEALPEKPAIHIHPDGSFTATNFPYFEEVRRNFEYRFKDLREIQSRWTFSEGGTVDNGWDEPRQYYGIRLNPLPPHLSFAGFTGIEKVDGIIFTFGNPDSGDAIIFKKK